MARSLFKPLGGIGVAILAAIALLTASCTNYPQSEPRIDDLAGRYVPSDSSDKRMRADSELVLHSDKTCELHNFPVISYSFVRPPARTFPLQELSLLEFPRKGDVCYSTSSGTWRVEDNITIAIDLPNQSEIELHILNAAPPYRIAQAAENIDDDVLSFIRAKQ
jgi:hypothetical protein